MSHRIQNDTGHFEESLIDLCRVSEGLARGACSVKLVISITETACFCQTM